MGDEALGKGVSDSDKPTEWVNIHDGVDRWLYPEIEFDPPGYVLTAFERPGGHQSYVESFSFEENHVRKDSYGVWTWVVSNWRT